MASCRERAAKKKIVRSVISGVLTTSKERTEGALSRHLEWSCSN